MKKSLLLLAITGALSLGNTYAADNEHKHSDDEKVGAIGPHVHGEANLNIAIDGNTLTFDLETPAMNVLGFEHEPSTDEQKETTANAKRDLTHVDDIFVIENGQCEVRAIDVDMPFEGHHHDEEHEHEHEGHTHADGSVHSDVDAGYTYECSDGAAVSQVTINIFDRFPGFHQLNVQWIANNKQGAQTLTKDERTISLK